MDGLDQALALVEAKAGRRDPVVTIQTFVDGDGESSAAPSIFQGPLRTLWARIEEFQEHGHGVFTPINRMDGRGRKASNVVALEALAVDCDGNAALDPLRLALRPSALVLTGRADHWHAYWWLKPGERLEDFTAAQEALARCLGTDLAVKDVSRVLRLPGTFNHKDRARPRPVDLVWAENGGRRYTIAEVLEAFGLDLARARAGAAMRGPDGPAGPAPAPPGPRDLSSPGLYAFQRYAESTLSIEGQNGNNAAFAVCAAAFQHGVPEDVAWKYLTESWNRTNAVPPWGLGELGKIFAHARRHHQRKGPVSAKYADAAAGIGPNGEGVVPEAAAENPQLDPASWCVELATGRWRLWDGESWVDGVPERALDRLLENTGDLGLRKREAWKKRVRVVHHAAPVFSSRERFAEVGRREVANLYRWPTLIPAPGDWSPIRAVLSNLVGGNAEHLEYVTAFLASVIQRAYAGAPRKKGVALSFYGPQGTGKGVLACVLQALLGVHNVATIGQGDLEGNHNAWLIARLFVIADEIAINLHRSAAQAARIKKLITSPTIMINAKGKDHIEIPSVEGWAFFSNSAHVQDLDRDDRRHSIFHTGGRIPVELGAQVADDARAGGPIVRAFLAALLELADPDRIAPDFRPLITQARADVARHSGTSATRWAAEIAARGFYSTTGAWAGEGVGRSLRDLYLAAPEGLRSLEHGGQVLAPVLTRRRLLEVYRAFAQEIGAPALREAAVLSALRDEVPSLVEAELAVEGRREPVVAGLPGMLPLGSTSPVAPAERELPAQRSLLL